MKMIAALRNQFGGHAVTQKSVSYTHLASPPARRTPRR